MVEFRCLGCFVFVLFSCFFFFTSFSHPSSWPWWRLFRDRHPPPAGWQSACGYAWICSGPYRRPPQIATQRPGHQTPRQPHLRLHSSWTSAPAPSAPWAREREKNGVIIKTHLECQFGPKPTLPRQDYPLIARLTMASIRALLSSSSLRRCIFSRSCRASPNDCKKVSKIPKNSSGCILPSSSPKYFRDLANCKGHVQFLDSDMKGPTGGCAHSFCSMQTGIL